MIRYFANMWIEKIYVYVLISDCEKGVEDLKSLKLDEMTSRLRNASMSSSSSYSTDTEVLRPIRIKKKHGQVCDFNEIVCF